MGEFGLGIAFDVKHPLVQSWLDDRAKFWAKRVNEETGKLLMQELKEAVDAGESVSQMQERVEKVFRLNDLIRSERIARTEMVASTNKGAIEAYRQSGIVEKKVWISQIDDRTREDHIAAHMQTVPLDSPFIVGGEQMDGPGQGGSADQVVNCRCGVGPLVSRGARSQKPTRQLVTATNGYTRFNPNHDDDGRFGEGDGDSSLSDKARRAKATHKTSTAAVQQQAENNEPKLAQAIGGQRSADNAPYDVVKGKHAIEVKTIVRGKNDKITMHPDSLARKTAAATKYGLTSHTVVFDDRVKSIYYRQGIGSFRLSGMKKVSLGDLKGLFA